MKKLIALAAVLCLTAAGAAFGEKYETMPEIFLFRQASVNETLGATSVKRTYPDTSSDAVDADMRALIDDMSARTVAATNETNAPPPDKIDTGAYAFRSGESAMSFLTISRAAKDERQTYVAFDARVYDLTDGALLRLTDLIAPDGEAWQTLAAAVRDTVTAYFPEETPDAAALDAACAREALENAAFTLTPARLVLHYRADRFYPGRDTLLHVPLAHRLWRPSMTERALRQTDCSRFKLIALTYDDGPVRGQTERVVDALREYGANATFFGIGMNYPRYPGVVCRQHDALFAVESHSYRHEYELTVQTAGQWADKARALMTSIIGIGPSMMRAPGGKYLKYQRANVMMPFIGWNLLSDDLDAKDEDQIVRRVVGLAADGKIVLMHDLCPLAASAARQILPMLEQRGYLCVTVAEMFDLFGIELTPNVEFNGQETTLAAQNP